MYYFFTCNLFHVNFLFNVGGVNQDALSGEVVIVESVLRNMYSV